MSAHTGVSTLRQAVTERGLRTGTHPENQAALILHHVGLDPEHQHQAGRYRLDFAWPDVKIALEVDGWYHRSPEGAARDRRRDSWLRSQGWVVFRVDDDHAGSLLAQVLRVAEIIFAVRNSPYASARGRSRSPKASPRMSSHTRGLDDENDT